MSLYRTWRPKSFADLVGQDAVVRTLRTALSSGRLAHAYLFSGPRGSGKTSAAKILARCIDCVLGPTPDPDNTCENCRAMLAGSALDVVELDAASNRGIDQIRELRDSAKFAPASMRAKVFIIDEAHMLTREGANAFLKTLEEPPAHVVFILATTAPEALPPTIVSRCQRYAFRRIPVAVMIERMRVIAAAEGIEIDDGALGAIAYRAEGGLRDALTMLEQAASYAGGAVDAAAVDAAFGTTGRQYARALVDAILRADAGGALRVVDEAGDAGADMLGLIRGTSGEYRNLLVARIDPELLSRDLSARDAEAAVALATATPQPKIVRGLRLLADALAAGRSSGNPRLELETVLLRLIVQTEDPSLEALSSRVALLEAGAGLVAAGPPRSARPGPVAAAPPRSVRPAPPELVETRPAQPRAELEASGVVAEPPVQPSAKRAEAPGAVAEPLVQPGDEPAEAPASDAELRAEAAQPPVAARAEPVDLIPNQAPAEGRAEPLEAPVEAPTFLSVRSQWNRIRQRAGEKYKPLLGPLSQATVDAVDGNTLTIGLVDAIHESLLRERTGVIEAALADVLRVPMRLIVRTKAGGARGGAPAQTTSAHRAAPQPAALASQRETETAAAPAASAVAPDGEVDLLAYARKKLGGSEIV